VNELTNRPVENCGVSDSVERTDRVGRGNCQSGGRVSPSDPLTGRVDTDGVPDIDIDRFVLRLLFSGFSGLSCGGSWLK
jgi:hypothetical protein